MSKGRTPGAKTIREVVIVETSSCPSCGSTDRTKYENPTEIEHGGVTSEGKPYTHVVWRNTSCKKCGQARRDKTFENRIGQATPAG